MAATSLLALFAFRAFPELDLAFSRLFFTQQECGTAVSGAVCGIFEYEFSTFWNAVREFGLQLPKLAAVLTLIWWLAEIFARDRTDGASFFAPLTGLIAFLLGPILVTNLVLKSFWGRPRPFTTSDFGGEYFYVLPGSVSDQCVSNCSFVSGEAASAFWMLWIVPFLPAGARPAAALCIGILAACISLLRVAFGRHYISDVAMAGLFTLTIIALSGWLVAILHRNGALHALADISNRLALAWQTGFKNLFFRFKRRR